VPYDVSRTIWGAYAEMLVPLAKSFELTGALRHDHYGDFGNTDNFKLAARYQPAREVLVRGSLGTGYRAPSVPQTSAGRQLYGVTGNTYGCPTAALTALQASDPATVCRPAGSQYDQLASGNSDLKPEKSRQWSLGLRLEPEKWLTAGVDLWGVDIEDRIGQLSEEVVMANPAAYLKNFATNVDPGTGRHYVSLYLPNENLGKERYFGADIDGKVSFGTPIGKGSVGLQWTHLFKYHYQRIKDGEWYSNLGMYNDGSVTFRNIFKLTGYLTTGALENSLTLNYKPSYLDQPCVGDPNQCGLVRVVRADGSIGATVDMVDHRVASYTTIDWQGKYEATKALSLTMGVINLFDRDPPLSIKTSGGHQLGYDNRYTDARGRTIYGRLAYKF